MGFIEELNLHLHLLLKPEPQIGKSEKLKIIKSEFIKNKYAVVSYFQFSNGNEMTTYMLPTRKLAKLDKKKAILAALLEVFRANFSSASDIYLMDKIPDEKELYKGAYIFIRGYQGQRVRLYYIDDKGIPFSLEVNQSKFSALALNVIKDDIPLKRQVNQQILDKLWDIIFNKHHDKVRDELIDDMGDELFNESKDDFIEAKNVRDEFKDKDTFIEIICKGSGQLVKPKNITGFNLFQVFLSQPKIVGEHRIIDPKDPEIDFTINFIYSALDPKSDICRGGVMYFLFHRISFFWQALYPSAIVGVFYNAINLASFLWLCGGLFFPKFQPPYMLALVHKILFKAYGSKPVPGSPFCVQENLEVKQSVQMKVGPGTDFQRCLAFYLYNLFRGSTDNRFSCQSDARALTHRPVNYDALAVTMFAYPDSVNFEIVKLVLAKIGVNFPDHLEEGLPCFAAKIVGLTASYVEKLLYSEQKSQVHTREIEYSSHYQNDQPQERFSKRTIEGSRIPHVASQLIYASNKQLGSKEQPLATAPEATSSQGTKKDSIMNDNNLFFTGRKTIPSNGENLSRGILSKL